MITQKICFFFRHLLSSTIFLLFTLIVMLSFYSIYPGPLNNESIFLLPANTSINNISNNLAKQGFIRSPRLFFLIARLIAVKYPLKSGEYLIPHHSSPYQILKILHLGKSIIHKITIVEGSTTKEAIDKINQLINLSGSIKTNIPEGHLLPSTYYFSYNEDRQKLIELISDSLIKELNKLMPNLDASSPIKTKEEVLTLASIVEKEAYLEEEKTIIASVFLNRIKANMPLQADPTVIYAISLGQFKLDRTLTKKDLQINSPYNTYQNTGLPPGPICLPSLTSIKAVIKPVKTDFLYFVATENNKHNFASNLSQHNTNVEKYRKLQKQKNTKLHK